MSALDLNPAQSVGQLAAHLTQYGVTTPGFEKWKTLKAALPTSFSRPAAPSDLLDRSPDELIALARERSTVQTANKSDADSQLAAIGTELNAALLESLRADADAIIAQLRGAFDTSADAMRQAVELGIKPEDTMQSLFHANTAIRKAWDTLPEHARKLDNVLAVRQSLSVCALVPPVPTLHGLPISDVAELSLGLSGSRGTGIDWSICVVDMTRPERLGLRDPHAPWARWLAAAPALQLNDVESMPTGFALVEMTNPSLAEQLKFAAARKAGQG
ncbi:hypothetical protein [Tessaracoccus lacteus]|uniref:Uncharacterized protein n=1 Tax=Tessaracoccus lacteus TaxID=3041766 RepID=A0ABY8PXL9_9ACTN|nr:hypothetical protein [Tessaracoccus sp. T21]WGT47226.1 hypothetical protein QH948_00060 [Tessaracoccus sp. T21]